ncbi:heparan-alpha-glucosaminide N-acetyltransferase domain-containing protein [Rothia nasimurium]|uniref:heparan-alpha-glucosaminide N-acetyltransferase domain-containing protein n=1 Tax=Rothia nasimurium TaxID=85336 RepID=UPI003BA01887
MNTSSPTPAALPDAPASEQPASSRPRARRAFSPATRFAPPRITGLDVARALAIIGMMAAHTIDYASPVYLNDPATWSGVVDGRPSLLFALLGGISLAFMTGTTQAPSPEDMPRTRLVLTGRALTIFAIGLALEQLGTNIAIILTLYGALYFIMIPFLRLSPAALLSWAAGFALLGPITLAALGILLPALGPGHSLIFQPHYNLPAWLALMLTGLALGRWIKEWTSWRTGLTLLGAGALLAALGYGTGALYAPEYVASDSSTVVKPADPSSSSSADTMPSSVPAEDLDLTGYLCDDYGDFVLCQTQAGSLTAEYYPDSTASGSLPMDSAEAISYNAWADYLLGIIEADWAGSTLDALFTAAPHSGATAEIIGSGGFALAIIGLSLLAVRLLSVALYPLAALGAMPLTAYSAHVVIIWLATGPSGQVSSPLFFWCLTAGLALFASLWLLFFPRGPLEALTLRAAQVFSGQSASPRRRPAHRAD